MIIELTQLPVPRAKAQQFLAGWKDAEPILLRQQGYISHRIGPMVENPEIYVLEIEWTTLEAHVEHFAKSPEFQDFLGKFVPYLEGDAKVFHFQCE